jgi:hypothetical protein
MDNLDNFSNTFFGNTPATADEPDKEVEDEEEVPENEDDALATEEDTDVSEAEEPTEDDEPTEEDDPEEEKPAKKGKKSFQDRIDELTAKAREAERREATLLQRLEQIEARKTEDTKPEPKPLREQLSEAAPKPDALDEDGEPLYKLGEFDPLYIQALTRFTLKEEREADKVAAAKTAEQQKVEAFQEELKNSWLEKVDAATEEIPNLRENLASMEAAFVGINPEYGEFLAATIMSCDYGPQIMNFLSQNIGEAQKIVASGPAAATLAIGRLDAKFVKAPVDEKKSNTKKVSTASKPPETATRGKGGRFSVPDDTHDLNAFEREFYKK